MSGWNKFDEAFLYRAYRQCGLPWRFDYHIFDVWSLYKRLQLIGKLPADLHLGLGTIARHFNIVRDGEDAHRAATDIEWTWRLYRLTIAQCPQPPQTCRRERSQSVRCRLASPYMPLYSLRCHIVHPCQRCGIAMPHGVLPVAMTLTSLTRGAVIVDP